MSMRIKKIKAELDGIESQINEIEAIYTMLNKSEGIINKGWFPIPLMVFTLVNYLGALYSGQAKFNEKQTVAFIREFFPKEYKGFPALIYIIFRHGLVHERIPKVIQFRKKGRKLSWYISPNGNFHLKIIRTTGSIGKGRLAITLSLKKLVEDLREGFIRYKKAVLSKTDLRKKFAQAYNDTRKPNKENDLLRSSKKKYLKQEEFDNMRKSIRQGIPEVRVG